MIYHILNGDALVDRFVATGLKGERVVARECLIEGDLSGDTIAAFYQARAHYLEATYNESSTHYFKDVVPEFEKIRAATDASEFNLWFGYDLFCQANMWFVISLIQSLPVQKQIFVVYPSHLSRNDIWKDFGKASPAQLVSCFDNRVLFTDTDLQLATELWEAYKNNDFTSLSRLSKQPSACFPYLEEVCQAHIDRFPAEGGKSRPERAIEALLADAPADFPAVFVEFFRQQGVYGFGDQQVKRIYDKVRQNRPH